MKSIIELRLEAAINEAGELMDVRLSKEDAEKILEMMKEREPKPVKITRNAYDYKFYHCPNCDHDFYDFYQKPNFCEKCGQAVKWDE